MKYLTLAIATLLMAAPAVAQQQQSRSPAAPSTATTTQDHNPSVATLTNANDSAAPAKGSNSFTEGQAKSRIADRGYTDVAGLKKDNDGVWHGSAQHNGQPVQVWLDYKGNVGEAH